MDGSQASLDPVAQRVYSLLEPDWRAAARRDVESGRSYIDLLGGDDPPSTGRAQDLMLGKLVPSVYEKWWRPALGRIAKGPRGPSMIDEFRIARLLLGLVPGDGVLDVACGTGNFSRRFARTVGPGGLVVGIDASRTMLDRAAALACEEGLDNLVYVRGDAAELPFRDGAFDAVCCFGALHLFAEPFRALDRMTSALCPGGRIAILTSVRARTAALRAVESIMTAQSGMRMFEEDEVSNALRDRGFVEISGRATGVVQIVGGRLPKNVF